ncbi:hypothetical protein [uncultured Sphaerochaeta sp.]|uniref:hypothetical protein n=1 Tax=uncultured Sphaerochaeta sp. TaxID=886478 RepID=UPI002A0A4976|nr:hypothetical protein [uncultured Sphaerochaeta sp.]
MKPEPGEELRLLHDVGEALRYPRGIVKDDEAGYPADEQEEIQQSLADAFPILPGQDLVYRDVCF